MHASRQLASQFDWREPIGLQERLREGVPITEKLSVMSRSCSQGTEVTIATETFSTVTANVKMYLKNRKLKINYEVKVNYEV